MIRPGPLGRLLGLGLRPDDPPGEVRCVRLVNGVTLLGLFACLVSLSMSIQGGLGSALLNLSAIVAFVIVLGLTATRRLLAAQITFSVVALLATVMQCVNVGLGAGVHYYLLPLAFVPFFIFPPQRMRVAAAFSVASGAAFAAAVWLGDHLPHANWEPESFALSVSLVAVLVTVIGGYARALALQAEAELGREHAANELLLREVLPPRIAEELLVGRSSCIEVYDEAVILQADIVGFTPLAESMAPERLVALLDALISAFDEVCDRHRIEKLKTVGDAYIAASGIPDREGDAAKRAIAAALDLRAASHQVSERLGTEVRLRIGVACGTVAAGVVGKRRYGLELVGEALSRAEALQVAGAPDRVAVDDGVRERGGDRYAYERVDVGTWQVEPATR